MIVPLLLLALTNGPATPSTKVALSAPSGAAARCCLTNQAYRGVCVVTLGEKETSESVLAYLNAPNTTGRTYCNSTRVRGGWEEVPCPPATPEPSAAPTELDGDLATCPAIPASAPR
jgi:hypothetical protein